METSEQGIPLFTAIGLLIGVVVIIQLWLLAASLDAVLGARPHVALAATFASLALFLVNAGLLGYVVAYDRRLDRRRRGGA
jgi:uncharacterized membrane protein YidH (DUF202 family)